MKIKQIITYYLEPNGRQAIRYGFKDYLLQIRTYKATEDLVIENISVPKGTLFTEDANMYWIRTNIPEGAFTDYHLKEFFDANKIVFVSEENFFTTKQYTDLVKSSKRYIKHSLKDAKACLKIHFERKTLLKELKKLKKKLNSIQGNL